MIYLFTGNSDYLVREKTKDWKNQYINKYGDFNMIHFRDLSLIEDNILNQELLAEGFMGEKKLILIDGFPLTSSEKNKFLVQKQDLLFDFIDKIPENNIIVFSNSNVDKRGKFYKKIVKIAEIKEFSTNNDSDILSIVEKKFNGKIDKTALNLLIRYKAGDLEKIISEIDKLLILNPYIDSYLVEGNIMPELEESIFQLIDDILDLKIESAIKKFNIILEQTVIYAFYNNLLANLRPYIFINLSKNLKISDISNFLELNNRSFLVNKKHKIKSKDLFSFYINLVNLDKKMKSGRMISSEEGILKYEIEKEIIKLKIAGGE